MGKTKALALKGLSQRTQEADSKRKPHLSFLMIRLQSQVQSQEQADNKNRRKQFKDFQI